MEQNYKIEKSEAISKIQYSGGAGTCSCLVSKTTKKNEVKDKKQTTQ